MAADPAFTARWLNGRHPHTPRLGIVLGSGFGDFIAQFPEAITIPYAEIPGFQPSTVPGHVGVLVLARHAGVPLAVLSGRQHLYEGHSAADITFPVRVLAALGVRELLLTNAAGGIRPDLTPGRLVALTDHLNWTGVSPLRGEPAPLGFVDLSDVYCPALRALLQEAAQAEGIDLATGVYLAVMGPSYETPAEIRAFATLGADLVGMSTVPEAVVGRQCGLRVAALSCVTNRAAGLGGRISHEEVLAAGALVRPRIARLLLRFIEQLAHHEH